LGIAKVEKLIKIKSDQNRVNEKMHKKPPPPGCVAGKRGQIYQPPLLFKL